MGTSVAPEQLTESGERCLRSLSSLRLIDLPTEQFISSILIPLESHVSRIVALVIAKSGVVNHRFVEEMLTKLERDIFDSWPGRIGWLSRGFSVQIQGTATYQRFTYLVEVRNAIIHGDGQFTDKQQKNFNALIELKKTLSKELDIECRGIRLSFGPNSQDLAFGIAVSFLAYFDSVVLSDFPEVKRI
ncbi:hypothetical protein [Nocardia amamiensis]|uniref:hypothetical protein n=1 Tax=Nocardia amamiensis TaxID=404578 RepID=UPI0012F4D730|nr:hypothetical protein [Nocardia amamiensis]